MKRTALLVLLLALQCFPNVCFAKPAYLQVCTRLSKVFAVVLTEVWVSRHPEDTPLHASIDSHGCAWVVIDAPEAGRYLVELGEDPAEPIASTTTNVGPRHARRIIFVFDDSGYQVRRRRTKNPTVTRWGLLGAREQARPPTDMELAPEKPVPSVSVRSHFHLERG